MLTVKKIEIYSRYQGEIDAWVRNNSKKELAIMSDEDWYLIDGFIQDLTLVKNGLVALEFSHSLNTKLHENCEDEETINKIKSLVSNK